MLYVSPNLGLYLTSQNHGQIWMDMTCLEMLVCQGIVVRQLGGGIWMCHDVEYMDMAINKDC